MPDNIERLNMSEERIFLDELNKMNFNASQTREIMYALFNDKLSIAEIKKFLLNKDYSKEEMSSIREFLQKDKLSSMYVLNDISKVALELKNIEDIDVGRRKLYELLTSYDFGDFKVNLHLSQELLTDLIFSRDENGRKKLCMPFHLIKKLDLSNLDLSDFAIYGLDFTDAYGVKIDPQKVYNRDLRKCKFKGVTFINNFDCCLINGSDFTGSINAKIDLDKVRGRDISGFLDYENDSFNYYWRDLGTIPEELKCYTNLNDTLILGAIDDVIHNYVICGNALFIERDKGLVRSK